MRDKYQFQAKRFGDDDEDKDDTIDLDNDKIRERL
jgi:hypothetical protein